MYFLFSSQRSKQSTDNRRKGFTLVELIVVLVILAVLAAILVPTLLGYIKKAKHAKILSEFNQLLTACEASFDECYSKFGEITEINAPAGYRGGVPNNWDINNNYANYGTTGFFMDEVKKLSEAQKNWIYQIQFNFKSNNKSEIRTISFKDESDWILYYNGKYYYSEDVIDDSTMMHNITEYSIWYRKQDGSYQKGSDKNAISWIKSDYWFHN